MIWNTLTNLRNTELPWKRLNDVSKRQDYVLDELKRLGVSIEVCPTSNLCIGGVPTIQEHPFIKLYNSGIDMAICTDDPGIFKSSLSDEIDFVINSFGIDTENLSKRMGDPFRLRLKKNNSHNKANEHNWVLNNISINIKLKIITICFSPHQHWIADRDCFLLGYFVMSCNKVKNLLL